MTNSKKIIAWPFLEHSGAFMTYAPFGRCGYIYALPDIRARYRIEQAFTFTFTGLYATCLVLMLLDAGCRGQPWQGSEMRVSFFVGILITVCCVSLFARQSRGLKVLSRPPSFIRCCTLTSESTSASLIWSLQFTAAGVFLLCIPSIQRNHPESAWHFIFSSVLIAAAVVVTLLCAFIMYLKQLSTNCVSTDVKQT